MLFRSLAVTVVMATANAHMIMESPVPFSVDKIDNGPISKSQFPCKKQLGYTVSEMNKMAVGEQQTISFKGSAIHGGGSCQLSVTTDTEPTENSVFKVIHSMEGACPGADGPEKFKYSLPDSIPNGKATFAWTWFSKMAGQPEIYMNCAPIEVTGGASDDSKFKELPDMFVGNFDKSCKQVDNKAIAFPNPGKSVTIGSTNDAVPPEGCNAGGAPPSEPGQPTPPAEGAPSPTPAPPSESVPIPPIEGTPSPIPTTPASEPSAPAAPEPTSAPPVAPEVPGYGPGNGTSTSTTLVTVTGTPTLPTGTAPVGTAPTSTGFPANPTEAPSAPGTCTTEGTIVCNGESQFGLCNHGKVVFQPVAAGTKCTNGKIARRNYNGRIARPRIMEKN